MNVGPWIGLSESELEGRVLHRYRHVEGTLQYCIPSGSEGTTLRFALTNDSGESRSETVKIMKGMDIEELRITPIDLYALPGRIAEVHAVDGGDGQADRYFVSVPEGWHVSGVRSHGNVEDNAWSYVTQNTDTGDGSGELEKREDMFWRDFVRSNPKSNTYYSQEEIEEAAELPLAGEPLSKLMRLENETLHDREIRRRELFREGGMLIDVEFGDLYGDEKPKTIEIKLETGWRIEDVAVTAIGECAEEGDFIMVDLTCDGDAKKMFSYPVFIFERDRTTSIGNQA